MLLNCGVGEDSGVPWTARRSNQSIPKEISPGISLEGTRELDWKKHKLESRLPAEISITSNMQMTPPLWQKVKKN